MGQEVWNFVVEVLRLSLFLYILRFHSSLTAWAGVMTYGWDVAIIRIRSGLITCWSSCGISYEWLVNWITTFIFSVFNFFHILDCPKKLPTFMPHYFFLQKTNFSQFQQKKVKIFNETKDKTYRIFYWSLQEIQYFCYYWKHVGTVHFLYVMNGEAMTGELLYNQFFLSLIIIAWICKIINCKTIIKSIRGALLSLFIDLYLCILSVVVLCNVWKPS